MKDYLKSFKESNSAKRFPLKEKIIRPLPEATVSGTALKSFALETVLKFMNEEEPDPNHVELSDEQKKEIEQKVREYASKPGLMALTYGSSRSKDEATLGARIDPTNKHDWIKAKDEIFYTMPYKYADVLHGFADDIWQKYQGEKEDEERVPMSIDKEKALKAVEQAAHLDWFAEYSEDTSVNIRYRENMNVLRNVMEKAALVDPEETKRLVKQYAPKEKHGWVDQEVGKVVSNKAKYAKNYKEL